MRKIEIKKWEELDKDGKKRSANTLVLLNAVVAGRKPEDIPRGIDKFRLFGRLAKSFEKADKSGLLELEETDYAFLKKSLEVNVVSTWAMNPKISEAVELFLNAEEVI